MSKCAFIDPQLCLTMALHRKPLADAESPRTRQMWLNYDSYSLPSHSDDVEICSALKGLHLYCRRQQPLDSKEA
jgi:hypothetical protein